MTENKIMPMLYCTWPYNNSFPRSLQSYFRNLDQLIKEIITSAKSSLLIVAPYLSPAGMDILKGSIGSAAQKGVWIRLITQDLDNPKGFNIQAIHSLLTGVEGEIIKNRLRILSPTKHHHILLHAKMIIADGMKGYLGSANVSLGALETNFELGVSLENIQAEALDRLMAYFESQSILIEQTKRILMACPH